MNRRIYFIITFLVPLTMNLLFIFYLYHRANDYSVINQTWTFKEMIVDGEIIEADRFQNNTPVFTSKNREYLFMSEDSSLYTGLLIKYSSNSYPNGFILANRNQNHNYFAYVSNTSNSQFYCKYDQLTITYNTETDFFGSMKIEYIFDAGDPYEYI